jgi:zinc/manganese transport system permease protein
MLHEWWAAPFALCLVVTGILGYLGLHVLERKVIFVDLATAQIAALGAAYAVLLGYEPNHAEDELALYGFSLGFALAGAALIALTRMRRERIPHEAIIGILYASASALAILVLSKTPTEGEQIKHMLVGSLLTVTWRTVGVTFAVCAAAGLFHWIFRRTFLQISVDPEAAERAGRSTRAWDFLFYLSFGVVITSCVTVAGVLLVFSYLIVPAVIAALFAARIGVRIPLAWAGGTLVSLLGLLLSNYGDFPPGPAIVACFAAVLALAGAAHYVAVSARRAAAARNLLAGAAAVVVVFWGTTFLRKSEEEHTHAAGDAFSRLKSALESDNETQQIEAIHHLEELNDPHAVEPLIDLLKRTRSDRVIDHTARLLAKRGAEAARPALKAIAARDLDADLKAVVAHALLDLKDPAGFPILIGVLETEEARIPREEAKKLIEAHASLSLDGVLSEDAAVRRAAVDRLKAWWAERGPALQWRAQIKRFE